MRNFIRPGKMSFILGGQYGSEGKGAASAYLMTQTGSQQPDIITTNAGVQSGHTSIHNGKKRVLFHLPTAAMFSDSMVHLNAGSIIDPDVLFREFDENPDFRYTRRLTIDPNAAIITQECRDAEMADDSAQTKIASTRKGVGQALARKILRSGLVAKDDPRLQPFIYQYSMNKELQGGASVLCEVPQGVSLSLNASPFYPHTTSRDCTVAQAMSDAGVHPHFMGETMLVLRTFPIRVGNIEQPATMLDAKVSHMLGYSGGAYPDQHEISFADLGVEAEITTVTKRVRRIFTWSDEQVEDAIRISRPSVIFLSFCDYYGKDDLDAVSRLVAKIKRMSEDVGGGRGVQVFTAYGPTTADVREG